MGISIEMSSVDPTVASVKSTYLVYSQTHSKEDRTKHFEAIAQISRALHLPEALALDSPSYIYQAERLQNSDSTLAPSAKAYSEKVTAFEDELQKQFPDVSAVKEKLEELGAAHKRFMNQFIPEFERQNPNWRDRTVPLVPV